MNEDGRCKCDCFWCSGYKRSPINVAQAGELQRLPPTIKLGFRINGGPLQEVQVMKKGDIYRFTCTKRVQFDTTDSFGNDSHTDDSRTNVTTIEYLGADDE